MLHRGVLQLRTNATKELAASTFRDEQGYPSTSLLGTVSRSHNLLFRFYFLFCLHLRF